MRTRQCFLHIPLRQHAGVHHQKAVFIMRERTMPQPVDQSGGVRCMENVIERIAAARMRGPNAITSRSAPRESGPRLIKSPVNQSGVLSDGAAFASKR